MKYYCKIWCPIHGWITIQYNNLSELNSSCSMCMEAIEKYIYRTKFQYKFVLKNIEKENE